MTREAHSNSSRAYLRDFLTRAAASVEAGQLVLDAGAGRSPYRRLFAHARYEAADFQAVPGKRYAAQQYVCDLAAIPVEDGRFDHVVCTQVLEHLPEPAAALAEFHRVLKPGGRLWLTAPFFFGVHETPYDFFRYTPYGLRHLLEGAGFTVDELGWLEGYLGTLSYQAGALSRGLPTDPLSWGGGLGGRGRALVARMATLMARYASGRLSELDRRYKFVRRGMPKNYQVVATRSAAD